MIESRREVPSSTEKTAVWEAYPSWAHFTWLYLFSALSLSRALLFLRFGVPGWEMWLVGAVLLILCAAFVRRWAHYSITLNSIVITNGYTGRQIQAMALSDVRDISIKQGPIASFFDIGTVAVRSRSCDRVLSLRGVREPEAVKERIEFLVPKQNDAGPDQAEAAAGRPG